MDVTVEYNDSIALMDEQDLPTWQQVDLAMLLYLPCMLINILMMVLIACRHQLRTPSYMVLLHACAVLTMMTIRVFVHHFHSRSMPIKVHSHSLCAFVITLDSGFFSSRAYSVLLVLAERYYTVRRCLMTGTQGPHVTWRHLAIALSALWVFIFTFNAIDIFAAHDGVFYYYNELFDNEFCIRVYSHSAVAVFVVVEVAIPTVGYVVLTGLLSHQWYMHGAHLGAPEPTTLSTVAHTSRQAVIATSVFTSLWLLQHVMFISEVFVSTFPMSVFHIFNIDMFLYPLMWILLVPELRQSCRETFLQCLRTVRPTTLSDEVRLI